MLKEINALKQLVIANPKNTQFVNQLANLYARSKDWNNAALCYEGAIKNNVKDAEMYFNHAYYLRFCEKYVQAIDQYKHALSLGISGAEEVYLNIGVIYSDYLRLEDKAKEALLAALAINSSYIPALYNLANIYEDEGNKEKALTLFEKVIAISPQSYDALARIAHIKKFSQTSDDVIQKLEWIIKHQQIDISTKINIYYALGKAYDDCKDYSNAFKNYQLANSEDKKTLSEYSLGNQERYINEIITTFEQAFFKQLPVISEASPVFICGMFRSGSTLVEQILAAHPQLEAGGEIEFFIRLVNKEFSPFPQSLLKKSIEEYKKVASAYLELLSKCFPGSNLVIDKRPENYLYIGLIKALFPNAKFIQTERNPLDNCMSIYFLRLGNRMNYATDLKNIAHQYKLQASMMQHWKLKYPESIHTINYDKLIEQPEMEIRKLLEFSNLPWSDNCLAFHEVKNKVKTASVWQVRQPLYKSSSGRWENYKSFLRPLIDEFPLVP